MYLHCCIVLISLLAVGLVLAGVAKNPNKGSALGELRCYECTTLNDGENCEKLDNHSRTLQCPAQYPHCMTKRFSYSFNPQVIKLWYMERNCSQQCDEYCITMGERVKIFACVSCCNEDFCNTGNGQASLMESQSTFYAVVLTICTTALTLLGSGSNIFNNVEMNV